MGPWRGSILGSGTFQPPGTDICPSRAANPPSWELVKANLTIELHRDYERSGMDGQAGQLGRDGVLPIMSIDVQVFANKSEMSIRTRDPLARV